MPYPQEFTIGDVYLPPMLVAAFLGLMATLITTRLLNRHRLSRYFANPPLAFVSMLVVYTVLIGTVFIGI
jgi:hypothetical protein